MKGNVWLFLEFGYFCLFIMIFSAISDNFFTVAQMFKRKIHDGIPLLWHLGFVSDVVLLTPLLAIQVAKYSERWQEQAVLSSVAISLVVTFALTVMWVNGSRGGLPEAMAHDGKLTLTGVFHVIYMVPAISVIILTFFHSYITRDDAITVSFFLGVHVVLGSHLILGLIGPRWFSGRPHRTLITWAAIFIPWGALAWRCLTLK